MPKFFAILTSLFLLIGTGAAIATFQPATLKFDSGTTVEQVETWMVAEGVDGFLTISHPFGKHEGYSISFHPKAARDYQAYADKHYHEYFDFLRAPGTSDRLIELAKLKNIDGC